MKSICLAVFLVGLSFLSNAQDSTIALSRFEKMATTPGNLYKFEEKVIGTVRGENVAVIKIRNINSDESLSVIRLAPNPFNVNSTPLIASSNLFIEKAEVKGLLNTLNLYSQEIKKQDQPSSTYFSYITSSDVQFLCKYRERAFSDSYLAISKLYQNLRTPVLFSTVYFNKKDIDPLIELLKAAASEI